MKLSTGESAVQNGKNTLQHGSSRLTKTLICATFTACLGAVSFGYLLGYPSPIQEDLKEKLKWNSQQVTWFNVSLMYTVLVLKFAQCWAIAGIGTVLGAPFLVLREI